MGFDSVERLLLSPEPQVSPPERELRRVFAGEGEALRLMAFEARAQAFDVKLVR